jgi:hypothetical protein
LRAVLAYPGAHVELLIDLQSSEEEISVLAGTQPWLCAGTSLRGLRAELLAHFRDVVSGHAPPRASLADALAVRHTMASLFAALAHAGAPFDRAGAPRHVASRSLAFRGV